MSKLSFDNTRHSRDEVWCKASKIIWGFECELITDIPSENRKILKAIGERALRVLCAYSLCEKSTNVSASAAAERFNISKNIIIELIKCEK